MCKLLIFLLLTLLSESLGVRVLKEAGTFEIDKGSPTVCKFKLLYQYVLFKNKDCSSSIKVGSDTLCDKPSKPEQYVTVDNNPSTKLKVVVKLQPGDYYRLVVTPIQNSCNGGTGGTGSSTKSPTTSATKCGIPITSTQGLIQSPDFPQNYKNDVNCCFNLSKSGDYCGVKINFLKFKLEKSGGCVKDCLDLNNKQYCGDDLNGKTHVFKLPLNMKFKTDSSIPDAGFSGHYSYTKDCKNNNKDCNKDFDASSGTITPPTYITGSTIGHYKNDVHCQYVIKKKNNAACVQIMIPTLTLENKDKVNCDKDYLEIAGEKICNKKGDDPIIKKVNFVDGDYVRARFVTDKTKNNLIGFKMIFTQIMDPSQCPSRRCVPDVNKKIQILKNPKNPSPYPSNMECVYVIRQQKGCEDVSLSLLSKLPSGDFLSVVEKDGKETPLEQDTAKKVKFDVDEKEGKGKIVKLKFTSDGSEETTFDVLSVQNCKDDGGDGGGDGGGGGKPTKAP